MPKERFELSRALCPLRPERSVSASSTTSAWNQYFTQFGIFVKCEIETVEKQVQKPFEQER